MELLAALGRKAALGRVATGDWFAVRSDRAIFIRDTFHPLLTEMEAARSPRCACGTMCPSWRSNLCRIICSGRARRRVFLDFAHAMEDLGAVVLPLAQALRKETL